MKYKKDYIKKVRSLNHVSRFSSVPRIKEQNASNHQFFVALYSRYLFDNYLKDKPSSCRLCNEIWELSLISEIGESLVTSIPDKLEQRIQIGSTLKEYGNSELFKGDSNYSIMAYEVVGIARLMDNLFYASEEISMGNKFFYPVLMANIEKIAERVHQFDKDNDTDLRKEVNTIIDSLVNMGGELEETDELTSINKGI
jgi:hypothetical protein